MDPKTNELFAHFMLYRNIVRETVPRNPTNAIYGVEIRIPAWFRACLVFAASHQYLITGSHDVYRETYLRHKAEVIRAVQQHVDSKPPGGILEVWAISLISCLTLNDIIHGEFDTAELHLRGLLTILDLKYQDGPESIRVYVQLQKRIALVNICFLIAARNQAPRSGHYASPFDRQTWANVDYLFIHIVHEFVRNKPITTADIFPERTDARIVRWLLTSPTLEEELSAERWECRMAVAGYVLTVGTLRRPDDDLKGRADLAANGESVESRSGRDQLRELSDWFDAHIAKWMDWAHPITDPEATRPVLDKIVWLQEQGEEQQAILSEMALDEAREPFQEAAALWGVF